LTLDRKFVMSGHRPFHQSGSRLGIASPMGVTMRLVKGWGHHQNDGD
jgi:hypothetical protein